jgi:hypothetical protein
MALSVAAIIRAAANHGGHQRNGSLSLAQQRRVAGNAWRSSVSSAGGVAETEIKMAKKLSK